jgi:Ion transport protein
MTNIPTNTVNDDIDEHHMYTQMIDPNHASLSIMTNSNDSTKDHHSATRNNDTKKSDDNNVESISSSSNVPTITSSKMGYRGASDAAIKASNHDIDANDDTESIASRVSFGSSTDGIDILRGNIGKPTNFIDWSHLIAARVVSSVLYKRSMLFCILLSSLLLAIRTVDRIRESSQMIENIGLVLHFLLIIFTVEMLLAIACFRELVVSTGWLCSDIVIICVVWYTNDSTFLILRAFRLIRALRKASSVPSLQWAVRSILHVLPRLTAVVVVLIPSMIAIFAILFTNLYQDADLLLADVYSDDQQQYGSSSQLFHRLDVSALTLFQIMTGGRNWADISTTLMSDNTYPLAWIPLIGYIIVSMFVATTLIIALMCDAVTTVKQNRMLKVFEHPNALNTNANCHPSKKNSVVAQVAAFVDVDYNPANVTESHQLYHRLEQKINELNNSVEVLLRTQIVLQESIERLSLQFQSDRCERGAHQATVPQAPLSPRQQQFQQQQLQPQPSLRNNNTASSNSYSTALLVPRLTSVPSDEH